MFVEDRQQRIPVRDRDPNLHVPEHVGGAFEPGGPVHCYRPRIFGEFRSDRFGVVSIGAAECSTGEVLPDLGDPVLAVAEVGHDDVRVERLDLFDNLPGGFQGFFGVLGTNQAHEIDQTVFTPAIDRCPVEVPPIDPNGIFGVPACPAADIADFRA